MSKPTNTPQLAGEKAYRNMEKMNPELFILTYGAFVMQLISDHQDVSVVNLELYKLGYNMGIRLIDEFLAKSEISSCKDFQETGTVIARVALMMFLGIDAEENTSLDTKTVTITLKQNPLIEFLTLPPGLDGLIYSNVICGAIAGALRMVQLVVNCYFSQEKLKGSPNDQIVITLIEVAQDIYQDDDE